MIWDEGMNSDLTLHSDWLVAVAATMRPTVGEAWSGTNWSQFFWSPFALIPLALHPFWKRATSLVNHHANKNKPVCNVPTTDSDVVFRSGLLSWFSRRVVATVVPSFVLTVTSSVLKQNVSRFFFLSKFLCLQFTLRSFIRRRRRRRMGSSPNVLRHGTF